MILKMRKFCIHFSISITFRKAAEQRRTQKPPNSLFNSAPKPTTAAVRAAATQRLTAGSRQTQTIQGNMVRLMLL